VPEAGELLAVEDRVLGERHHHAFETYRASRDEVTDEDSRLPMRDPDATDAGVDTDVDL
jgi:hypothetical protein